MEKLISAVIVVGKVWQYGYDGGIYAKLADKEGTIEEFEGVNKV